MSTTSVIVFGASGRMGSRLCALADADPAFALLAAIVRADSPRIGQPVRDVASADVRFENPAFSRRFQGIPRCVVIDFSGDIGTREALAVAIDLNAALVVGTTALSHSTIDSLGAAAAKIPLLITPNTSIGVAVLSAAVALVARSLGTDFDCSIAESHHRHKKDAPSGTAIRLAEAARSAGARLPEDQITSSRGGDVIGEHTVRFAGPGEYLELTHRATSRDLFARGALHAAAWLAPQPPGWYTMQDVLKVAP